MLVQLNRFACTTAKPEQSMPAHCVVLGLFNRHRQQLPQECLATDFVPASLLRRNPGAVANVRQQHERQWLRQAVQMPASSEAVCTAAAFMRSSFLAVEGRHAGVP